MKLNRLKEIEQINKQLRDQSCTEQKIKTLLDKRQYLIEQSTPSTGPFVCGFNAPLPVSLGGTGSTDPAQLSGVLPVISGGTGLSSISLNGILIGNNSSTPTVQTISGSVIDSSSVQSFANKIIDGNCNTITATNIYAGTNIFTFPSTVPLLNSGIQVTGITGSFLSTSYFIPTNPEPGSGSLIYVGNSYTIPTAVAGTGVFVKIEPPIIDTIVGQLGDLFDPTVTTSGELVYSSTLDRILLISYNLKIRTTNTLSNDFVRAILYVNGVPFNNGLLEATTYVSNLFGTSVTIPVGGGPLQAGDILSIYIANLTSASDLELQFPSIMMGGFSFTTIEL
jgi:hypothetical protein